MELQLKVGDVIYKKHRNQISSKYTIDRVTKTQAISESGVKFKINYHQDGFIDICGNRDSIGVFYKLETIKLKEEYIRYHLLSKLNYFKFDTLTTEQLESIEKIINKTV